MATLSEVELITITMRLIALVPIDRQHKLLAEAYKIMNIDKIIKDSLAFNWDVGIDMLRDEIKGNNKSIDVDQFEWNLRVMHTHMVILKLTESGAPFKAWQEELTKEQYEILEYLIGQWVMVTFDHDNRIINLFTKYLAGQGISIQC